MTLGSKVERIIDLISEWLGRAGWLIVLYAMLFGTTDVILRYMFNRPSQWIGVTLQYSMVLLACVGGAYTLKSDSFVRVDLFYSRLRSRGKAICDAITFPAAFLYLLVLIWKGAQAASQSFAVKQVTPTAIPIPLYHLKAFIPLAVFFVLLVAVNKFILDIRTIMRDRGAGD